MSEIPMNLDLLDGSTTKYDKVPVVRNHRIEEHQVPQPLSGGGVGVRPRTGAG